MFQYEIFYFLLHFYDDLRNIYTETKFLYAEELVETVIVPLFQTDLELEIDREVQATSVNLLVDVAKETESESFFAITSILGGIVNTKLENGRIVEVGPEELADYWLNVDAVVCGLVEILQSKWNRSSADQSLFVFDLLVRHLNLEYSGYDQMEPSLGGQVREAIFALILHLRASWNGRVGLASAKGVDYSAFITAVLSGADDTAVAPGTVGEDTAPDSIKVRNI